MNRDEMIAKVEDAIWSALEGQAHRFGYIDREIGVVDMGAGELDMAEIAAAAVDAVLDSMSPPF